MKEYITDTAIVRIHPGERTEDERRKALEKAARSFYAAIHRSGPAKKEYIR